MLRARVPRTPRALAAWRRRAIERMARSRAATLRLVATLPQELANQPGAVGAWSVKDVLVHLAAWEAEGARRLALIARGRGDRIRFYDTRAEVDRFNARAVRAGRRWSLRQVLGRLARARDRLLATLRRVPVRALADRRHELPVVVWLREFAWAHETAHRREIRAWWRARRGAQRPRRGPAR